MRMPQFLVELCPAILLNVESDLLFEERRSNDLRLRIRRRHMGHFCRVWLLRTASYLAIRRKPPIHGPVQFEEERCSQLSSRSTG